MNNGQNFKILSIEKSHLLEILRGNLHITNKLPIDVSFSEVYYNYSARSFELILESKSFPKVPKGAAGDLIMVELKKTIK